MRGCPASDRGSRQGGAVAPVRGTARVRRWGAQGAARFVGSRTPVQSARPAAAAHRSVDTPAHRRRTSGASTRPTGIQPGTVPRNGRPRQAPPTFPAPTRHPCETLAAPAPLAARRAEPARRSTESGSPAAAVSTRRAVQATPADGNADASCRPPSGDAASARSRPHGSGTAAPGPGAAAARNDTPAPTDRGGRLGRPARHAGRTRRHGRDRVPGLSAQRLQAGRRTGARGLPPEDRAPPPLD
jgi:hypothetical protein